MPPLVEELLPMPDVMAALSAVSGWPRVLLLDSAGVKSERGRYTFLMADPLETWELAGDNATGEGDPFRQLRAWSARIAAPAIDGLPPFQGGTAGLMGYELGRCWEQLPASSANSTIPRLSVGLYPWVIAWDHQQSRAFAIVHGWTDTDAAAAKHRCATERLQRLRDRLKSPLARQTSTTESEPGRLPAWARQVAPGLWSDFQRDEYLHALQRVIDYIHAGDIFQANLTQRLLCRAPCPPLELYARLREVNPAPFAGYFAGDGWTILSASPERFLHCRDGIVTTRPIKGTRRRSSQAEADLFTRDSLRQSEKDQAENVMIVDLLRNDLSRVCRPDSVSVPQLCAVETFATVQHLVSEVRGELVDGMTPWDLFAASFPGGSITGAPKVRAMEIIAELEPTPRGPYTGSLFYVGHDGATDSNLLIRTFVQQDGWLQCGVGGGIVAQSDPEAEYAETWHKATGMLQAVGLKPAH